MMNEWLDIVDEADQVIGRALRADIHARGHRHRACHMLLWNSHGEVFVQRRSPRKDTNPGLWDTSAAGHVDAGETYLEAATREVAEELGIVVCPSVFSPVHRFSPSPANGFEFIEVYEFVSDLPLRLDPIEIDEGAWRAPDRLEQWMSAEPHCFTDVFRSLWQVVRDARSLAIPRV